MAIFHSKMLVHQRVVILISVDPRKSEPHPQLRICSQDQEEEVVKAVEDERKALEEEKKAAEKAPRRNGGKLVFFFRIVISGKCPWFYFFHTPLTHLPTALLSVLPTMNILHVLTIC